MVVQMDTYLRCTSHNSIVTRSGTSDRIIHKKSGGLCDSARITLVRTTILSRGEALEWSDRIEAGIQAEIGH
jgi:hypothetical protein